MPRDSDMEKAKAKLAAQPKKGAGWPGCLIMAAFRMLCLGLFIHGVLFAMGAVDALFVRMGFYVP